MVYGADVFDAQRRRLDHASLRVRVMKEEENITIPHSSDSCDTSCSKEEWAEMFVTATLKNGLQLTVRVPKRKLCHYHPKLQQIVGDFVSHINTFSATCNTTSCEVPQKHASVCQTHAVHPNVVAKCRS